MFIARSPRKLILCAVLASACGNVSNSADGGAGGTGGASAGGRGGAAGAAGGPGGASGTGGATGGSGGAAGTGGATGAGGSATGGAGGAGAGGTGGGGTGGSGGSGGSGAAGAGGAAATGGTGATGGAAATGGATAGRGGAGGTAGGTAGTGGGTAGTGGGTAGTGGSTAGTGGSTAGTGGACVTSDSGTVYDPAGVLPLYNVRVYSPTQPLADFAETVGCFRCAPPSGAPAAVATSDLQGKFKLEGIPAGTNVPLVYEVGKWRRQVALPSVTACADTPITDVNLSRLPRSKAEGHIPKIAITTGAGDALECFIRRIGIIDDEFTTDAGQGRVNIYAGGDGTNSFTTGGTFPAATTLWSSPSKLATYDMIGFSCEGSTSKFAAQKPQSSVDNIQSYANLGGRLLFSHLHLYWLRNASDFNGTAAPYDEMSPLAQVTATVNQTHAGGMALAQWLAGPAVNASTTLGQISLNGVEHSVTSVNPPTTEWLYVTGSGLNSRAVPFLSFQTPVPMPAAQQCGKVMFADMHVQTSLGDGGGDDSDIGKPFPSGCKTNMMTPQMKALEFLFFDLGACL